MQDEAKSCLFSLIDCVFNCNLSVCVRFNPPGVHAAVSQISKLIVSRCVNAVNERACVCPRVHVCGCLYPYVVQPMPSS